MQHEVVEDCIHIERRLKLANFKFCLDVLDCEECLERFRFSKRDMLRIIDHTWAGKCILTSQIEGVAERSLRYRLLPSTGELLRVLYGRIRSQSSA